MGIGVCVCVYCRYMCVLVGWLGWYRGGVERGWVSNF